MDEITTEQAGDCFIIRLSGVLDRRLSTLMREEMARASLRDGVRSFLIGLSGVTRMDSMGVGMLVSAFRSCQSRNMAFALVGLAERTSEILSITGLDKILPIHQTEEEARDALNQPISNKANILPPL